MSHRFQKCIDSRGLRKCQVDSEKVEREITEAKNDLESAKASLQGSDHKWAIIKAYFSMFHACKSLLFSEGYSEKSHDCVIIAVGKLFTDTGKLPPLIVTNIRSAKTAREAADYGCTYGADSARGAIEDAEEVYRIISEYHKTV